MALLAVFLLGLAASGAQAAPAVEDLVVINSFFSPDGDGIQDTTAVRFTAAADSATVTVAVQVITDPGGALVATPHPAAAVASGDTVWVGWTPAIGEVPDGDYRYTISIDDGAATATDSVSVVVDTEAPTVALGAVGPSPFDPGADLLNELSVPLVVTGDPTSSGTVQIWSGTTYIRSLGTTSGPGAETFTWDGMLAGDSTLATTGRFEVRAVAVDYAGHEVEDALFVQVDREGPSFIFDTAETTLTTSFPTDVRGRALDLHRVDSVSASFDSGNTWVPADSLGDGGAVRSWVVTVEDAAPVPGVREIWLSATDRFGHEVDTTLHVAFDTVLPAVSSSMVLDDDSRYRDGESVTIRTVWNATGLDVSADFSELDSGYPSVPETVTDNGDGTYLIEYRITPTNSADAGSKLVEITATTGILSGKDEVILALEDAHGDDLVSLDRNRFDPETGDVLTIAAPSPVAELRVEVFDIAGHSVRILEGEGSVEWNGNDDEGRRTASGVYFLRILVGTDEEKRKVAVIRGGGS